MADYKDPRPSPTASAAEPCVIYDNAVSFNEVVNGDATVTTYTGKQIISLSQAIDKFGFGIAPFTFAVGGTLEGLNLLVSNSPTDGFLYKYVGAGSAPITVTAGTDPTISADWQAFVALDHALFSGRNPADGSAHNADDIATFGRKMSDTVRDQANVLDYGASPSNTGSQNDAAFSACLSATGAIFIPSGNILKTANGVKIGSFQAIDFGGGAALEPDNPNIEVLKFQGDYSNGFNVRILNSGGFTGCDGLAFTPSAPLIRTGQRHNRIYQSYIEGVHNACVFQCGDFVTAEGFASGCWYNEIYGGEWRTLTGRGFYFKKGLNTNSGVTTQEPATSNRNTFYGVSIHFCQGAGIKIEAGETNTWHSYNYESCNFAGSVAVDIDLQASGTPPNPNSHNRFISCGSEGVTKSVEINNTFTVFDWCTWERTATDNWGNIKASQVTEPSRMPFVNPLIEREDFDFGRGRFTGRGYLKATRGFEYTNNDFGAVPVQFTVHDKGFQWQTLDLSGAITNATYVSSVARYQRAGNTVDIFMRVRVSNITGDVQITMPAGLGFAASYYSGGLNDQYFNLIKTNEGGTTTEIGQYVSATNIKMIASASLGGQPEFHINLRYRISDSI